LDGLLLVGTINSIGARRSASAVDVLVRRLNEGDEQVASAAAIALGKIGNEAAIQAGHQAFANATPAVRSAIAEAGILAAERRLAEGKNEAAAELYDLVRNADIPQQRILEATRGAIIARGDEGIPLLVEQLKSQGNDRFQFALSTSRELAGRKIVDALATQLAAVPPERAALIVHAIGDRADAVLPAAVLQAAKVGEGQVRLAAIQLVGRLGDASAVPTLLETATGSDAEIAQAAKAALIRLPGKNVDSEIASRLPSAKGKSQLILIELVGERRFEATPELVNAMNSSDKSIRDTALIALGETVKFDDLKVLISKLVTAKNDADREITEKALLTASIRMPNREATAAKLTDSMSNASPTAKASMMRILGAMGGPKALETIAAEVKSGDEQMQDVGTNVLGKWMTADAAPVLLEITKDPSNDKKYKVRALRGYLRIARQLKIPDDERIEMCRQALAIAERPDERGLALDALKQCPSAEAVELASSLLDDRELRDRAVETAIFIGEQIKEKDPAAAKTAGEKALEAAPPG
jgi:HEAT repeat protein